MSCIDLTIDTYVESTLLYIHLVACMLVFSQNNCSSSRDQAQGSNYMYV